jgi:hypothetical protein
LCVCARNAIYLRPHFQLSADLWDGLWKQIPKMPVVRVTHLTESRARAAAQCNLFPKETYAQNSLRPLHSLNPGLILFPVFPVRLNLTERALPPAGPPTAGQTPRVASARRPRTVGYAWSHPWGASLSRCVECCPRAIGCHGQGVFRGASGDHGPVVFLSRALASARKAFSSSISSGRIFACSCHSMASW